MWRLLVINGTGTFTQNATSTNIISDALSLGSSPNGSGTYTMKGGYLQTGGSR